MAVLVAYVAESHWHGRPRRYAFCCAFAGKNIPAQTACRDAVGTHTASVFVTALVAWVIGVRYQLFGVGDCLGGVKQHEWIADMAVGPTRTLQLCCSERRPSRHGVST